MGKLTPWFRFFGEDDDAVEERRRPAPADMRRLLLNNVNAASRADTASVEANNANNMGHRHIIRAI